MTPKLTKSLTTYQEALMSKFHHTTELHTKRACATSTHIKKHNMVRTLRPP
jgi:hypothetical protein